MALLIVLVVIAALLIFFVIGFNKLRKLDVATTEAMSGIDVALTRRSELIPNLVETVKGYAAHERVVFSEVTAARAATQAAATVQEKANADAQLSQALLRLNAVAEAYPELKANENFLALQEELTSTENRIAFSRQHYNASAGKLNTAVATIPWLLFTGVTGVSRRDFYEADASARTSPSVTF